MNKAEQSHDSKKLKTCYNLFDGGNSSGSGTLENSLNLYNID